MATTRVSAADSSASGEALENYDDLVFSEWLPHKPGWCLHVARVGCCLIARAGYLRGGHDVDLVPEKFPNEISWIFEENQNETWTRVFKEDLAKVVRISRARETALPGQIYNGALNGLPQKSGKLRVNGRGFS